MEEIAPYDIAAIKIDEKNGLSCLESSDAKTMILQWNLDKTLEFKKFRFTGAFDGNSDYDRLIKDFLRNNECTSTLGITGTPSAPFKMNTIELNTEIMSMNFFDKLEENDICHNGHIRGCFEEIYDGLTVNDKLRDMLVNEDSDNAFIFTESEKKEFIYNIFKMLVVGGSMCQPDNSTTRYLETTKGLYKDLLTVYKAPTSGAVTVSGKVFALKSVDGMTLHPNEDKPYNTLLLIVEPLRKEMSVLKVDYVPYW
jgi:cilia- and flagella-associated protein 300